MARPLRNCHHEGARWAAGVYEQSAGLRGCFRMVADYEQKRGRQFETLIRMRADSGRSIYAEQSVYCSIKDIDRSSVHMHIHPNGLFYDNFAILPRVYAESFFNNMEDGEDLSPL